MFSECTNSYIYNHYCYVITGALINKNGKYGFGERPIIYSNLDCFGHETKLSKCSKQVYPDFTCYSQYVVGLLCLDSKCMYIPITKCVYEFHRDNSNEVFLFCLRISESTIEHEQSIA